MVSMKYNFKFARGLAADVTMQQCSSVLLIVMETILIS